MYFLVGLVVLTLLGASFVGSFRPLGVFGGKRRIAVATGIASLLGGSAALDALDPDKGSAAAIARANFDAVRSAPETFLQLEARYARDFGRLEVSGTLKNRSDYLLTDVKLNCWSFAENRSRLNQESIRLKKLVPPRGDASFGPLDVMRLDQQTHGARCEIKDANIADADCAAFASDARCKIDHLP